MKTTLVLGIGNTLLTDEGIGVHVVDFLEKNHPELKDVTFVDGGTLSFTLAELLATHDNLIVVDAARTGGDAGNVVCYEGDDMDNYLTGNRQSVHEVGLTDLLDIARLSDHYPENRALVGIEPHSLGWGEEPSDFVVPSIPVAGQQVIGLLSKWGCC